MRGGKINQGIYNRFTGSLDCLSGMEQLKELWISNTDINEVQIDKLPRSLKKILYSTYYRPNCKLTTLIPLLNKHFSNHGRCFKCWLANTSENWCQPCAEQEWKQLTGQELINKFIEQQGKYQNDKDKLQWIPYEEFTNIEHIADGGFSKIYKVKYKGNNIKDRLTNKGINKVVLKSLNNSQNITLEFLTEIANTKLVDNTSCVVKCHGISQDPTTKNYLMVMEYMKDGNLRQYLQNKNSRLGLKDKLGRLRSIVFGLYKIHQQNLVHQDFHSGNILNSSGIWNTSITDLGLSRLVNHKKQKGQIFGVLPYVAPEVLRGQPYTQKADIYSFGIIAYEFLVNSFPYPEMDNTELTLRVCNGYRPNLDKIPLPQELKDLIKNCWDSNPNKRPRTEMLFSIIANWTGKKKKNTSFYRQYQAIKAEYNTFSKNTPYQIHANAATTSKMIDTKKITERLKTMERSLDSFSLKKGLEYSISIEPIDFTNLNLKENKKEDNNHDWTIIHPSFTDELIQQWKEHNFTFEQGRDWINVGLKPTDANFCVWLRDIKQLTSEQVLNHGNQEQLNQEFFNWWQQQQQQNQIEQPPKK